jgi:5'-deoxynucleotidase YfbR-like HD superfamily hydrolase
MSTYNWSKHVPGPHEIETFTGKYVDLKNPQAHSIDLESVAHGLANTCRYNGQVRFYSVAEHAVMCARRLERQGHDPWFQLAGLHHDDAEAFLGDVTRPLKSLFQPLYDELTLLMDSAIRVALQLPFDDNVPTESILASPAVKDADNWALLVEAWHLLPSRGINWGGSAINWSVDMAASKDEDADLWTGGMDPWSAADLWLAHHRRLMEDIDDINDAREAIEFTVSGHTYEALR